MSDTVCRQADSLAIHGALTQQNVPTLWPLAPQWIAAPLHELNLAKLTHIDSAGLAWLLELENQVRQQDGALQWRNVPAPLMHLMRLYDLTLVDGHLQGTAATARS